MDSEARQVSYNVPFFPLQYCSLGDPSNGFHSAERSAAE